MTASLSAGTGISQRVLAGLQLDAWSDRDAGVREILSSLTGTLRVYPLQGTRLFGTAGAGLSSYWSSRSWFYGVGWGLTAGAGYDLWTRGHWSLSPVVKISYGMVGDLHSDGAIFLTGWKQRVVDAGIQFRWNSARHGRGPSVAQVSRP
jgi:hypothetical protein